MNRDQFLTGVADLTRLADEIGEYLLHDGLLMVGTGESWVETVRNTAFLIQRSLTVEELGLNPTILQPLFGFAETIANTYRFHSSVPAGTGERWKEQLLRIVGNIRKVDPQTGADTHDLISGQYAA